MSEPEYNKDQEMNRIVKEMAPEPSNGGEMDASYPGDAYGSQGRLTEEDRPSRPAPIYEESDFDRTSGTDENGDWVR